MSSGESLVALARLVREFHDLTACTSQAGEDEVVCLHGRSAIAHTSSTNRSPSGARETQGSMAPAARSVAVSRWSR